MSALTELGPLVNPVPVPFYARGVTVILVADILGRISGWDTLRVMWKPSTLVRYAGIITLLREHPDVRMCTDGPEHAAARRLASMYPATSKRLLSFKPAAENDFFILRWSILRDMDAIRNLFLNASRSHISELRGNKDPVALSALWAASSLKKYCPLFAEDWAQTCATLTGVA